MFIANYSAYVDLMKSYIDFISVECVIYESVQKSAKKSDAVQYGVLSLLWCHQNESNTSFTF